MRAVIYWSHITEDRDARWSLVRVLYAYVSQNDHEILYIGKADGVTVRQRWNRLAKENFWKDLEQVRHIFKHAVLVGEIQMDAGCRLTRELLADIESLLIKHVGSWGNIQSRNSRISRPGLRVICRGDWPLEKHEFDDAG